jgi:hypothetical protein
MATPALRQNAAIIVGTTRFTCLIERASLFCVIDDFKTIFLLNFKENSFVDKLSAGNSETGHIH